MTELLPAGHAPLEYHQLANLFPPMNERERTSLAENIRQNGLRDPVTVYDDGRGPKILDGRNRYEACTALGIDVRTERFEGALVDALKLVISRNLERRHLSDKDRAKVAAKIATSRLGDNQFTRVAPAQMSGPELPLAPSLPREAGEGAERSEAGGGTTPPGAFGATLPLQGRDGDAASSRPTSQRTSWPTGHTVKMTRGEGGKFSGPDSVGTCECGAVFRFPVSGHLAQDAAIEAHWAQFDATAPAIDGRGGLISHAEAAALMNVKLRSTEHAAVIEAKGSAELKAAVAGPIALSVGSTIATLPLEAQRAVVAQGEQAILAEAKRIRAERNTVRRTERADKIKQIAEGSTELGTVKKYPVILIDPPTKFAAGDSDRSTENHYPTMTYEELEPLPIGDLATPDAVLFIHSTVPWLEKTLALIRHWGFEYKSNAVWDKMVVGTGFWWQNQHEFLIAATRGNMVAPESGSILGPSVHRERKGPHSRKPNHFRDAIAAVPEYRGMPKIELFCRGPAAPGWDAWGNQATPPELPLDGRARVPAGSPDDDDDREAEAANEAAEAAAGSPAREAAE